MIEFSNQQTNITFESGLKPTYFDLIDMGVNAFIATGLNRQTMELVRSIKTQLSKEKLTLDSDLLKLLKLAMQGMEGRWTIVSEDLENLIDTVNSLDINAE